MQAGGEENTSTYSPQAHPLVVGTVDEERGFGLQTVPAHQHAARSLISSNGHSEGARSSATEIEEETELQTRPNSMAEAASASDNFIKRKTSRLLQVVSGINRGSTPLTPQLMALVDAYARSDIASSLRVEIDSLSETLTQAVPGGNDPTQLPDVTADSTLLRGRRRANWATQFRILSGRAFKNLYRDPALLAAHYFSSIAIAST